MSAISGPTPAELSITPRDRRFGRHTASPRLWHGGRVEATAIYNALSATFPLGEAFFVESVRAFRDGAPPRLAEEIKGFTTQEAIHSREHDAFNKRAASAGYDLLKLEAQVAKRLALTKERPLIVSLAATMALEHFTAILAHALLADPRHLSGAEQEAADRLEDRPERVAVARQDHPRRERSGAALAERVEGHVDDLARVALAVPRTFDRLGDPAGDAAGDRARKLGLEPGGRAEMMEQVGVGAADLGSDRLQRNGLRSLLEQQPRSGVERGGPALFRAEAPPSY
jgi:hypothetical protein